MGTAADGGKGSKGRAANGNRPIAAPSYRREQHTKGDMPTPPPPPPLPGGAESLEAPKAPKKTFGLN